MKGRDMKLLDRKILKKLHEFIVAVGTFGGLVMMTFLTFAKVNGIISWKFFANGMALSVVITYICIKQIDKHFDGENWN